MKVRSHLGHCRSLFLCSYSCLASDIGLLKALLQVEQYRILWFVWWCVVSSCTLSRTTLHSLHLYLLGVTFLLRVCHVILIVPFFSEEVLGWEIDLGGVSTETSDSTSVSASYGFTSGPGSPGKLIEGCSDCCVCALTRSSDGPLAEGIMFLM